MTIYILGAVVAVGVLLFFGGLAGRQVAPTSFEDDYAPAADTTPQTPREAFTGRWMRSTAS